MTLKTRPAQNSLKQNINKLQKNDKINNPYRKTLIEIQNITYKEYGFISETVYTWRIIGEGLRKEKYMVVIELFENSDYNSYVMDLDNQCKLGQLTEEDLCLEYNS